MLKVNQIPHTSVSKHSCLEGAMVHASTISTVDLKVCSVGVTVLQGSPRRSYFYYFAQTALHRTKLRCPTVK